jgi:uncharacterized pyridoxal phosphate-dependent enzyme
MQNIYSKYGLRQVINASGRMTALGVSTITDDVGKVMVEAAQNYVVINELFEIAGKRIGSLIGCQDACVTSSASAGMALAVSSLICKNDLYKIENFKRAVNSTKKKEVILLKGHNVNFGAPVSTIIELGGGDVVEVGYANHSKAQDILGAINENTLAIFYVKSHHCVQKSMLSAKEVIELANKAGIPCIVDASAEEDLSIYMKMGADFVCYSGAKSICGPTSGFVACKTEELASNMRLQYHGIGRAMKIGKENITGLLKAIENYQTAETHSVIGIEELTEFVKKVNEIKGLKSTIIQDEAGRKIFRAEIVFNESVFGRNARSVADYLSKQDPAIFTRNHQANVGILFIDPRPINSKDELNEILRRLVELKKG